MFNGPGRSLDSALCKLQENVLQPCPNSSDRIRYVYPNQILLITLSSVHTFQLCLKTY